MKKCRICAVGISNFHGNRKYCKKCSEKVMMLVRKLVAIKERCFNKNHVNYKNYKNVKICNDWIEDSFKFVAWSLKNGWESKLQIDRINNYLGYSPENCRYVTRSENMRNKRNAVTDWGNRRRKCRVCKNIKKFYDFAVSRKEVGGIAYECRLCRKEIDRIRWKKHQTATKFYKS